MLKREDKAWLLSFIVTVGFSCAVFFHYYFAAYKGVSYPKNTFLFDPTDHFRDFYNILNPVQAGAPFSYRWSVYFPFTYLPFSLFGWFRPQLALVIFLTIFIATTVSFLYLHLDFLSRYQRLTVTFILSCLSYPVLFCIDRGNIEGLLFVFLCLFFICYQHHYVKGSIFFLACATAMKLYPGVFVVLFLARRQYKAALWTAALTTLLTVLSAAIYSGGIMGSFHGLMGNLSQYRELYIIGDGGLAFGASYFGPLKVLFRKFNPNAVEQMLLPYTLACLIGFALLGLYVMFCEQVFWKQITILTFVMILFPTVSSDYKLIHILLPVIFFVVAADEKRATLYAILFGLLLIPKAYFWFAHDVSISIVLNPLLMTIIMLLIISDGLYQHAQGMSRRLALAQI